jgi:hypothetical protein
MATALAADNLGCQDGIDRSICSCSTANDMKSPFPGMDPYLEAHWGDVHTSVVTYARDQLRRQLPAGLQVRVEERVTVAVDEGGPQAFYPDVRILERHPTFASTFAATATIAAEPLLVPLEIEPETERSIHIIDSHSGNRLVTAIEVLSPSNKSGPKGRRAYHTKQQELIAGGVNLIEIDLLRDGAYMLTAPPANVPDKYMWPYRICVFRAARPSRAEVYRTSLREPLPAIRVPLRTEDQDVTLDLQALINLSWENGGYEDIDYRQEPIPPLVGDDAVWADALLREKGLR